MPLLSFEVESYTLLTSQAGITPNGAWRNVVLTSRDLSHGIRNRASVYFFANGPGAGPLGVVTNVDQPNYSGIAAYAYLFKVDFAEWYDILRNEAPLTCVFGYTGPDFDPSQPVRQLSWIQLFTGQPEPPGEGAEHHQAMFFAPEALDVLRAAPDQ
jgi:hypothetical protein